MTIAATLRAITTVRRPFGHRVRALPNEREAMHEYVALPSSHRGGSTPRQTPDVELLAQSWLRLLGR